MVRIPNPGAVCHVLNRGERRGAVFVENQDRRRFLETLERRGHGDPTKVLLALEWRVRATMP